MYSLTLAEKSQASIVVFLTTSPVTHMSIYRSYQPSLRTTRRFSGVLQSWFPPIHQSTFPATSAAGLLESAIRRTVIRA